MIEARSIILNEKLIVRVLKLAVGDPSADVRQNGAAHRLEHPLHHILPGFGFRFSGFASVVWGVGA